MRSQSSDEGASLKDPQLMLTYTFPDGPFRPAPELMVTVAEWKGEEGS